MSILRLTVDVETWLDPSDVLEMLQDFAEGFSEDSDLSEQSACVEGVE